VDLFQELQDALASGHVPSSMPVCHSTPACNDLQLEDSGNPNFGIELPCMSVKFQVSVDSPTYPWPSKAHFLMELLFSSPWLPFSEAQKRAILSWVKELGAQDVLSLYGLNSCHEEIKKLIGNPTKKVVSASGNIFYINDVANAIAKDYTNPLTHFAMQDFPEDGGKGMSQVFQGEKLLHELPSPPAIQVDGTVYFVDELLQECSGDYFFPECFFLAASEAMGGDSAGPLQPKVVYALGHTAKWMEAGFIVSDEREIIPTSLFCRLLEEISCLSSEL
ncbi:hypothetical protein EDC04DRAFT_2539208, partial [Pisolithus marmoratus]